MATETVGADSGPAKHHSMTAVAVLDELGSFICRTTALLRAAVNTGSGETEDEGWLVGLALEEMEAARRRYYDLALGSSAPETRQ